MPSSPKSRREVWPMWWDISELVGKEILRLMHVAGFHKDEFKSGLNPRLLDDASMWVKSQTQQSSSSSSRR